MQHMKPKPLNEYLDNLTAMLWWPFVRLCLSICKGIVEMVTAFWVAGIELFESIANHGIRIIQHIRR